MVRYIIAKHIGESDALYRKGHTYPLAIKVRFFSRRVSIYRRRGYYDEAVPGSERDFRNMESFEQVFQVTEWKDF